MEKQEAINDQQESDEEEGSEFLVDDVSINSFSVIRKAHQHDSQMKNKKIISKSDRQFGTSDRSDSTSQKESHFTSIEAPPRIYEEVMQSLEADIRKHIRIEHQLKLHIESVEDRVEELEKEQDEFTALVKELQTYKDKYLAAENEVKLKEEVLEVK